MIHLTDIKIQRFAPLSNYTTWRVGGTAEWLAEPINFDQIKRLINWSKEQRIQCQIIGAGSNLLINDKGLKGLIICMRKVHGLTINQTNGLVEVFAGESIPNLARRVAKAGLHGMEWAIGIPGTVGGAVVMNAGAQGSCIADWLESVRVMTLDGQKTFEITKTDLEYSYRNSRLQKEALIVLSARFKLETGHDKKQLNKLTNQNLLHRINSQPYDLPSCGSVFRNPEPLKAARLIEALGLKGHKIGGAEISKVHANFIVNTGGASAKDIKKLITLIQIRVQKAYGLMLNTEVKHLDEQPSD